MDTSQTSSGYLHIPLSELPSLTPEASLAISKLNKQILDLAIGDPSQFSQGVVDALVHELGLTGATMYIRSRGLDGFKLKSASGFEYADYDTFLRKNPSYPSLACAATELSVLVAFPPFEDSHYSNLKVLTDRQVAALIVVPFHSPADRLPSYPEPMGVICMYARSNNEVDLITVVGAELLALIGSIYAASLDRLCMQLREEIVRQAAFSKSLTDMCYKVVKISCERVGFDAGSVWLLQPRRQQLVLKAAWPRLRSPKHRNEHFARLAGEKSRNPLVQTFQERMRAHYPRRATNCNDHRIYVQVDSEKVAEDYGKILQNTVLQALVVPGDQKVMLGNESRDALGVLQLTNKYTVLGDVKRYLDPTWEDILLIEYIAGIASVLVYQGLRSLDHEGDYERRIHGLKINLIAARDNLQQLEDLVDFAALISDHRLRHHLSNALVWIREIEQQVGRGDNIERLKPRPQLVSLQAGVVAKAVSAARNVARARHVPGFQILADEILDRAVILPDVYADPRVLATVFRNLFENSVKYRDQDSETCRIRLWPEASDDRWVRINYQDDGIGIGDAERRLIFEYGYRGKLARRVNPVGEGIGLHECQIAMISMGASIACELPASWSRGAHFVLHLPRFSL